MGIYQLENAKVSVTVDEKGAELLSMKKDGNEYLWNGDPAFWGRRAPILFPFVGGLKNKQYTYEGQTFSMGQHGFARDMTFEMVKKTNQSLRFEVASTEETKKIYPFDFLLAIEYTLQDNHLEVLWEVQNKGSKEMYFSIGGHPGFFCPFMGEGERTEYSIRFMKGSKPLTDIASHEIGVDGLVSGAVNEYSLQDGLLPVTKDLFAKDALVLEGHQTDEIALMTPSGKPYVTLRFQTPLVGVWSPNKEDVPFICIEPWCGRCDHTDFSGELSKREYGNVLAPGKTFREQYEIVVE